jgi:hypothetical protein
MTVLAAHATMDSEDDADWDRDDDESEDESEEEAGDEAEQDARQRADAELAYAALSGLPPFDRLLPKDMQPLAPGGQGAGCVVMAVLSVVVALGALARGGLT